MPKRLIPLPASDLGIQWETLKVTSKYKMQKHRNTPTLKTYNYRIITQDPGIKYLVATGYSREDIDQIWEDL